MTEIIHDGVRLVPSREAARRFNITNDYIGRLCKTGKVSGSLISGSWYVNEDSLRDFLLKTNREKYERREALREERAHAYREAQSRLLGDSIPAKRAVVGEKKSMVPPRPLRIHAAPRRLPKSFSVFAQRGLAVMFAVVVIVGGIRFSDAGVFRVARETLPAAAVLAGLSNLSQAGAYSSLSDRLRFDRSNEAYWIWYEMNGATIDQPIPSGLAEEDSSIIGRIVDAVTPGSISEALLNARLASLESRLLALISLVPPSNSVAPVYHYYIDNTNGVGGGGFDDIDITNSTYTGGSITGATITGGSVTATAFDGVLPVVNGGTGTSTYAVGDILYADSPATLGRLAQGSNGQVLKVVGGNLVWSQDLAGGGGGSGAFATTSDDLAIYVADTSDVVIIGANATSTTGNILEIAGTTLMRGVLTAYNTITAPIFTATSTNATSTMPRLNITGSLGIGSDYITDISGDGLSVQSGALSLDRTGDWTGTFDGLEGSYYLANSFSTTSASHFIAQQNLSGFSTTSADYWKTQRDFFATTSTDYWKSVSNFFSTTSAEYFLSQNQEEAFSTTSAAYFLSQQSLGGFSTTSADFWQTQRNFFSTTSTDYWKSVNNFFSTTSADFWKTANNFFSTTSADAWKDQRNFFSTTSASYFLAQNQGNAFSTTSADHHLASYDKGFFFSTTSANYFLSQQGNLGFSTTSNDYWMTQRNFFSTSSADYYKLVNNFFSTSSADYWQTTKNFFSTTSAAYFLSQNQGAAFSTTSANYFIHSSTTVPKLYTSNTWTGGNIFGNATTSYATTTNLFVTDTFAGAGLGACNASSDKLVYNANTKQFECGSDAGAGGGITSLRAEYSSSQTDSAQVFATSSDTNIGLTITSAGGTHTFTPVWSGVLSVARGGTGIVSAPNYGQLLVGDGLGGYVLAATSSLGLSSSSFSTTSADYWQSQRNFFSTTSAQYFAHSSTTIPKTYTTNTFTALQNFANASSTLFSASYASTTALFANTASTSNLTISALQNGLLKVNASGVVSLAVAGTDYQTFGYLFPNNATSTLLAFNGGLTAYASSTIGGGTQASGLTIKGGATTTGNAYIAGSLGVGTNSNLNGAITANGTFGVQAEGDIFRQYDSGDAAWYPIIARYNTANGSYPASTYIFGNGANAKVAFEVPGGGNLTTFQVRANTATFNGALTAGSATTTQLGISGIPSALLATDANGTVYATTSLSSSYLNTSGNWTGTFDGQEGSFYLANSFSTTSADYYKLVNNFFSTTSADYWQTTKDFFSTTSANYFAASSTTIPKTYTNNTFTGTNAFSAITLGSLNGPLQANNGVISATSSILAIYGGTGQTSYSVGDILYADSAGSLARLPAGGSGQVLKISGGLPTWGADITSGGGGGATAWSTTTDSLAIYPTNTSNVLIVGNSATATANSIMEVFGRSYFSQNVGIGTTSPGSMLAVSGNILANRITGASFTATSTTASVFPYASTTALSATTLCLSSDCRTSWPTDSEFSTTSADYWKTQRDFFSTTSASYFSSIGLAWSTTSANYYLSQNGALGFSTTSNDYWMTQRNFFSTTSANYWSSLGLGFSTSSADAWKDARNFFSTTSAAYFLSQNQGNAFSTTSANYWESQQAPRTADDLSNNSIEDLQDVSAMTENYGDLLGWNGSSWADVATSSLGLPTFSDLSSNLANYLSLAAWYATTTDGLAQGSTNRYYDDGLVQTYLNTVTKGFFFSTTSADAWKDQRNFFSTTSAAYFTHSSTTIPKTYTANAFTALQTFANASSTLFSSVYASSTFANIGTLNLGAALTVSNGGTGSTTLTGILKGNGTGAIQTAIPGVDYLNSTSGDWTGTFDGQEGSYYLANSFSTTSANYWSSLGLGFSTTSNDYWMTQRNFFSTTSANYWKSVNDFFSTTSAMYFTHSSTTIPKTYTTNTFTALQNFANASSTLFSASYASTTALFANTASTSNLTISALQNGLLKVNASGVVSLAVAGTDYQTFGYLFPNNATSTLLAFNGGIIANASSSITALSSVTSTSTNATSTNLFATNGRFLNATTTSLGVNGETFTDLTGSGLLNTAGVLTLDTSGNWTGTFDGQEGSYYLANGFSTTSADYWKTQRDFFSTTSVNYWKSVNDFFSTTSANYFVSSSTTIPKTYTANAFTALQSFSNASSTLFSSSYASSTRLFAGAFTLGSLNGPLQANNGLVSATTSIGVLYGGTGLTSAPTYGQMLVGNSSGGYTLTSTSTLGLPTFAYPFPNNATSTLLAFNGGLTAYASSTIGGGTQTTGLTISGGATTTGNAYFAGSVATAMIRDGSNVSAVDVANRRLLSASTVNAVDFSSASAIKLSQYTTNGFLTASGGNGTLTVDTTLSTSGGNLGVGTTSPYAKLSVAGEVVGANFTATTTAVNTFPTLLSANASTTNFGITGLPSALLATDASGRVYATTSISSGLLNTTGNWTGTFDGQEGSYYLANSFSTTSANYWSSLGLGFSTTSNDYWMTQRNFFSTTSANYWKSVNDFFSTTSAMYFTHSSTTIPKTYTTNTFTALQNFANASSTLFSASYASTTNLFTNTASTSNLTISALQNGLLKVNASGAVSLAVAGTDYQTFGYLFPNNATSTLLSFNGGLTAYASSTIGGGTQTTGLTISGGATTTGYLKVLGTATSSFAGPLAITSSGTSTFANGIQISAGCFRDVNGNCIGNQDLSAYVDGAGSGSTNRVAYWSDNNTLTSDADFSFDGTTVTARDLLISHTAPLLSINDTGSTGTDFRIDVSSGGTTFNADIGANLSEEFFAWATNNDEKMRLSEEGYLGIGTPTPSAPLYMQKNGFDHVANGSLMAIGIFADSVQNKGIMLGYNDNEGLGVIAAHSDGSSNGLSFMTANGGWGERMRLTAAGSLGIGTDSPSQKLEVYGTDHTYVRIANDGGGKDAGLEFNSGTDQMMIGLLEASGCGAGSLGVYTSNVGDCLFSITQNGSVGIGTTSPASLFSLAGTSGIFASTTATSTFFGGGINLVTSSGNTGCFAINGTCITGSSGASFAYPFTSGTNFGATTQSTTTNMSLFGGLNASSTVRFGNAGQPMFLFNGTNGRLGLGTSTPGAMLSIAGDTIGNKFTGAYFVATSSIASQFPYASTTAITATTASTTNLVISALQNGLLKVNASGVVSLAAAGTDYSNFAYLFPSNATSTTLRFNNGLLSTASSTFTADTYFPGGVWGADGSVNIGQTSGTNLFSVRNNGMSPYPIVAYTSTGFGYGAFTEFSGSMGLLLAEGSLGETRIQLHSSGVSYLNGGNVGIGSSTPGSLLSIGNTNGINFSTATSTFGGTGGIDLRNGGCYAINGTCLSTGGGASFAYPFSLTGNATSTLTQFNGGITAYASSTIGNGNQNGGLTISGGATTTGIAYFDGYVGIRKTSPLAALDVDGSGLFSGGVNITNGLNVLGFSYLTSALISSDLDVIGQATTTGKAYFGARVGIGTSTPWATLSVHSTAATPQFVIGSSTTQFIVDKSGFVGVGTTTPGSLFAIGSTNGINFTTATSTFGGTGGIDLRNGGCYAINGTCITGGSSGASDFTFALNFAATNAATSSILWAQSGINASSTSRFADITSYGMIKFATTTVTGSSYRLMSFNDPNTFGSSLPFMTASTTGLNLSLGLSALSGVTTGTMNTALGQTAAGELSTGENNTAVGTQAMLYGDGSYNTVLGAQSLMTQSGSGSRNTVVGANAMFNFIGGTPGSDNVAVGYFAMSSQSSSPGSGNVAIGASTLSDSAFAGSQNIAIGQNAGNSVLNGTGNILIGSASTAGNLTTGHGNLGIGNNTFFPSATASGQLNIGGLIFGNLPATSTSLVTNPAGRIGIGTTTRTFARLTIASSTEAQLSLSSGAPGIAQWAFRNAGGNLYFSTTTAVGTATTTISALEISGSGFGTTTVRGLNISGFATSTSNVGFNLTAGCYAINGTCISAGGSSFAYPFPAGATSSPLMLLASTTIGGGTQTTGLTISGGATTTGNAYFAGNVAIGTTTLTEKLTVHGNIKINDNVISPDSVTLDAETAIGLRITNPNGYVSVTPLNTSGAHIYTSLPRFYFNVTPTSIGGAFSAYSTADLKLQTGSGGATRMTILASNGNVGVGTTTPWATLSVHSSAGTPQFVVGSSTATQFIVDAGGRVGVGVVEPLAKLHVVDATNITPDANGVGQFMISGSGYVGFTALDATAMYVGHNSSARRLDLMTNETSRLSITGGGLVGVGTTTPGSLFAIGNTNGINFSTATSTFGGTGGIDLRNGGCFAINGTCITGGSGSSQWTTAGSNIHFNTGNVGIGTSTPSSPLEVAGYVTIGSTNSDQYSLKFTGVGTNSYYIGKRSANASSALGIVYGSGPANENGIFLDQSGRVGIATSTPWGKLSINPIAGDTGPAFAIGSSTANMFSVTRSGVGSIFNFGMNATNTVPNNQRYAWTIATSSTGSPLFRIDTTTGAETVTLGSLGSDVYIGDVGSPSNLVFEENSTIKGSGSGKTLTFGANSDIINFGVNVGIGTTSPDTKLQIAGGDFSIQQGYKIGLRTADNAGIGSYLLQDDDNSVYFGNTYQALHLLSESAFPITFSTNNSERMRIDSSGNVGISTTTPRYKLSVFDSTAPQLALSAGAGVAQWAFRNAGGNLYFSTTTVAGTATTTLPAFLINGATGRLGIGTTTPNSKLTVHSNVTGATSSALTMFVASFVNTSNSTTGHGISIVAGSNSTAGSAMVQFYRPDGTNLGGIRQNAAGTVQYNTGSDRRIKENITPSSLGLADLMRIPVLEFSYISDPSHARATGFMAQDLHTVFPDAVGTNGDNGLTTLSSTSTPWAVDYGRVTPLIVKAIQDLNNFVFGSRTSTSTIATSTLSQLVSSTSTPLEARVQDMALALDSIASSTATTSIATGEKTFLGRMFTRIAQWFADAANGIGEFFAGRIHTKEICVGESGNETCITKQQLDALLSNAGNSGGSQSAPAPSPNPEPEIGGGSASSTPPVVEGGEEESVTEEEDPVVEVSSEPTATETPPAPVSESSDDGGDAS